MREMQKEKANLFSAPPVFIGAFNNTSVSKEVYKFIAGHEETDKDGKDKNYFTDFIARVENGKGETVNLMIEISGMSKDKAEKKWYVENRWIPAVNAVQEKYNLGKWHFIEIANDIRDIRNQLANKIRSLQ